MVIIYRCNAIPQTNLSKHNLAKISPKTRPITSSIASPIRLSISDFKMALTLQNLKPIYAVALITMSPSIFIHVNYVAAHKHDLILIPNQTIHSSGQGVLVLEISATPYIFTFKLYDWVRPDLSGKPRPLNIDRGMQNLDFNRQGQRVFDEHVSKPSVILRGRDWQKVHLPTHPLHFYDVYRYEFDSEIELDTDGDTMHVMSLVEGTAIQIETDNGMSTRFNYVETFVIPAVTGKYKLVNLGQGRAKVVHVVMKRV